MPPSASGSLRWSCLLWAVTVLGCASQRPHQEVAAEPSAATAPAPQEEADPLAGLDAETRAQLEPLLADELCPCGCPHTLGSCPLEHDCVHARRATALLGRMLARGMPGSEALYQLGRYYQGMAEPRSELAADPRQCRGPADAPVTLVVFADFECPSCKASAPLFERVSAGESQVRVCSLAFPLPVHPNAMIAAQAALFAREHGAYFELHDAMLAHQGPLDPATLVSLGEAQGLDGAALQQALAEGVHLDEVRAQRMLGSNAGVGSTPSYFLNGHQIHLPLNEENLRQAITEELEWVTNGGAFAPDPEAH